MPPKKLSVSELLTQAVPDRHSPLYRAMRDNYGELHAAFLKKRLDWTKLVAGFREMGVLDGEGKPPSVRNAQNTWARVRKDMGEGKPKESKPAPPPPLPKAAAEQFPEPPPAFNPQETADTPAPGFSYKPSKLK